MDVFSLFAKISLDTSEYDQGLDAASDRTQSFGSKLKSGLATAAKAGAVAVGAATTAVGLFAKSSVDVGMSFDASMSKVGAISRASSGDLELLRDKALEMGSSTKFSATEAAEAMNYMAMAGWKTKDMLRGIEGIMNLAAASGEDLATTSDIVTDALTAFGLSADDSTHFADVLAVASSNANTNVSMMGETFKYVAPLAGALGYSADDTAVTIGLMANAGIKASQAGTSLRSILTRLSTDAGASSKSLGALGVLTQELGVQFYNADGSTRDLMSVLLDAREAWKGLTEEEQVNYATTIAGQEAMSGWLAIMNAAPKDVEKLASAVENADDASADMAKTMTDNLSGAITMFKSALEGAQILLSDQLTPTLTEFVNFGTESIATLSTAFKEGGLTGAMDALGTILSDGIEMVVSQIPKFIDAGMQLLGAIGTGIMENLPVVITAAQEVIVTLAGGLSTALPELVPAVVETVIQIVDSLIDNADQLIEAALEIILALADGLIEAIPRLLEKAPVIIDKLVKAITNNLPKIIRTGTELIIKMLSGIINALPQLVNVAPQIIYSLIAGAMSVFYELAMLGQNMISQIWNGLQGVISNARQWGRDMIDGFASGITSGLRNLLDTVKNLANRIKSFLHFSRPDEGPLRDYETWMPDFMAGLASGIRANTWRVEDALKDATAGMADLSVPVTSGLTVVRKEAISGQRIEAKPNSLASGLSGGITININGIQFSTVQELAQAVGQEVQAAVDRKVYAYGAPTPA